ncbi:18561_t:CDS:2, partial [Gigaspora rosea]
NEETRQQVVQISGPEEPRVIETEDTTSSMGLDNENELEGNSQGGSPSPNKETLTEDKKQALVIQHEKQVQDTNIDDTKSGMINEVEEGSTQKREPEIKLTNMVQSKQVETPEEVTQVATNSDTTEKHGMILEAPTQQLTNEMQETTLMRDELTANPIFKF